MLLRMEVTEDTNILYETAAVQSGTFSLILLKLATSPFPPQTKFNFEQNGWKWVLFGHNTAGRSGGGGGGGAKGPNPKPIKKLLFGA